MSYILVRTDGAFVAVIGLNRGGSYTRDLQKARIYSSLEAAERDRCPGNESIQTVEDYLPRRGQ